MAIGNKIAAARRKCNLTQDQLAEMLNVTRQSVSRWESETAYPETDKLVKLSKILELDLTYLLDDDVIENNYKAKDTQENRKSGNTNFSNFVSSLHYEYKSTKTWKGMPLVHVNFGLGAYKAKGVIAIGNMAYGIISIGLLSFGLLSVGLLTFGLLAIGMLAIGLVAGGSFAIGILAVGAICLGVFAFGAIAIGMISFGAVSVGLFSYGALSYGKYIAVGDRAFGDIAIGMTSAAGRIFESFSGVQNVFSYDKAEVLSVIDANVPTFWAWFISIFKSIL